MQNQRMFLTPVIIALASTLVGCAAIQQENATQAEQTLAAAGFNMKLADSPEKLAHLKTLTQLKVVPHEQNGNIRYIYADAQYCKCLYAGDEAANQRYQKMVIKQNVAQMNQDAAMNWGMWGPGWGW